MVAVTSAVQLIAPFLCLIGRNRRATARAARSLVYALNAHTRHKKSRSCRPLDAGTTAAPPTQPPPHTGAGLFRVHSVRAPQTGRKVATGSTALRSRHWLRSLRSPPCLLRAHYMHTTQARAAALPAPRFRAVVPIPHILRRAARRALRRGCAYTVLPCAAPCGAVVPMLQSIGIYKRT